MPKLSATALKTRIEQLQKQLAAAEASKAPAIAKVRALMKKLGVTTDDLVGPAASGRRGRPPKQTNGAAEEGAAATGKGRKSRGKVAVKYRDDKGNAWTGRGKTPRWIVEAESAGKSRESFKIS
jgi:DNA-binding protein H-NS